MGKKLKRILSAILMVAMVFTAFGFVNARSNGYDLTIENGQSREQIDGSKSVDDNEIVSIIVKLPGKPVLTVAELGTKDADSLSTGMIAEQNKVAEVISSNLLANSQIEVKYHYTLLFNGFSFYGEYGLIEKIKKLDGVLDCYASQIFEVPEDIKPDEPSKLSSSIGWINADGMWALGYTGQGQTIAVIDTGIKTNHPNFATAPIEPHFDSNGIQSILDQYDLCAEDRYTGTLSSTNLYYSAKLPFTFNYVTGTTDVSHGTAGSDHGTHVSSIAAGNDSSAKGVAYNAQIISMQVFENRSGAWSDILAALEDCVYLQVDALNMSLGSCCGFSVGESDMNDVFALLGEQGVNCSVSAGNSTVSGNGNEFNGRNPVFNIDKGIAGSPGTFAMPLCVASSSDTSSSTPSGFSSWGTTSDLCIKPEIMAPGDGIYAATDPNYSYSNYGTKSGTSMSAPHIAGGMVLIKQYIDTNFPNFSETEKMNMVNTLLMCTAVPSMVYTTPYSPRQQGAGLANLTAAISTEAYISVDGSVRPKLELGDDDERTGIFTLTFNVTNFGDTALTYTVNTSVLTEGTNTMSINGQSVNYLTNSPYNITDDVTVTGPASITVPANGTTIVTITVDVNDYAATLNEKFSAGAYIDGYVFLDGEVDLAIPYLGFYGDWEYASVLDREFYYDDFVGGGEWPAAWGVNSAGSSIGASEYIEFGMNPFTTTSDFLFDRASISPNGDGKMDAIDTAYTYLLRNCEYFEYAIVDADTGYEYYNQKCYWEVKMYDRYEYAEPIGSQEYNRITPWDGSDLPDGTTVILRMTGFMHSYDEFDVEANENAYWEIPVTIDTLEPRVDYWNLSNGELVIYVSDNHYTSFVGVYSDANCTNLITSTAVEENARGAMSMLSFDVGNRDQVYVKVGDYAYNYITQAISGEGGSLEPIDLNGISFEEPEAETYEGFGAVVNLIRNPIDANNFEVVWSSADESIATVRGGILKATVTGVSEGTTTIAAVATDKNTGESFTATMRIEVLGYPDINDALNVPGGNLLFTSSGNYSWVIDMESDAGRLTARSGNQGVSGSTSAVTMDIVTLEAGESITFDWRVSSESNYDYLEFLVNGNMNQQISGNVGWTTITYTALTSGNYIFKWQYRKDGSVNSNEDTGWVDNVRLNLADQPEPMLGDVDQDGVITVADGLIAMRGAMGIMSLTEQQIAAADIDGVNGVTVSDAIVILRVAMNIIEL